MRNLLHDNRFQELEDQKPLRVALPGVQMCCLAQSQLVTKTFTTRNKAESTPQAIRMPQKGQAEES
jgi:deoxyxylulose-5-phosphate synthase